jgi:hypothetical protein
MTLRKLRNLLEFYKRIAFFNFLCSLLIAFLIDIESAFYYFIGIGFLLGFGIYEIQNKKYYLFYSNNGLSKIKLILFGFGFNLIVGISFLALFRLFENVYYFRNR